MNFLMLCESNRSVTKLRLSICALSYFLAAAVVIPGKIIDSFEVEIGLVEAIG